MNINGKKYSYKNISITELLNELSLNPEKVVIELNTEIIRLENYYNTILKETDELEIISFVGGG